MDTRGEVPQLQEKKAALNLHLLLNASNMEGKECKRFAKGARKDSEFFMAEETSSAQERTENIPGT